MTKDVYLNDIALAVPDHDVHRTFIAFAPSLLKDDRSKALFRRMAAHSVCNGCVKHWMTCNRILCYLAATLGIFKRSPFLAASIER